MSGDVIGPRLRAFSMLKRGHPNPGHCPSHKQQQRLWPRFTPIHASYDGRQARRDAAIARCDEWLGLRQNLYFDIATDRFASGRRSPEKALPDCFVGISSFTCRIFPPHSFQSKQRAVTSAHYAGNASQPWRRRFFFRISRMQLPVVDRIV